jgi:hypothetical protein
MAGIYGDQHCELNDLLGRANNDQGATLLIPDLQRPYVWTPGQVTRLVDSLIRGWPFGTFLTWKVGKEDPVRELARPFWKVVDRTEGDAATQVSKKNPPASFQMALDGQQRIQSLLLACCGDGWGLKLYDRDWNIALAEEKPKGRQGGGHWSIGCLCVDLELLVSSYATTKRIVALDFTNILKWVVTGGKQAQSDFRKKPNYVEPLPRTHDEGGKERYVRLSRLWEAAPTAEGVEQEDAEKMAEAILKEHEVKEERLSATARPLGSLLLTLARVKKTRVTYLELAEFDERIFTRESYNDAVVNIFTRLNSAGRVLAREDITFAWLKVGWVSAKTENRSATECFDGLAESLAIQKLELSIEQLVAGISFIWSTFHAGGRLLNNNDLLKGDAIRPMAGDLSTNWALISSAVDKASANLAERGYRFHEHYESLNSVFILWSWQYIADQWLASHTCKELEKDDYEKRIAATFSLFADRWLMCSQWAGRWAIASAETIAGYAKRLSECADSVRAATTSAAAAQRLQEFLAAEVKALEVDALAGLQTIQARRRELVRIYYAPLWIWHRLDAKRWKMSQIPLRTSKRRKINLHVDHSIAHALWEKKLAIALPSGITEKDEALALINQIGNCALLEKSFNLSKSDRTLKSFLDEVHEFKTGKIPLAEWAGPLGLPESMVDPSSVDVDTLVKAIADRDRLVREELSEFVTGKRSRVDLEE